MKVLYTSGTNSTTGGVALAGAGTDVQVFRLVVGAPVANANIYLYHNTNVGNVSNTTGLAAKLTLPSSFATGQLPFTIDLTDQHGSGLELNSGGSVAIDQTLQLTTLWDYSSQTGGKQ